MRCRCAARSSRIVDCAVADRLDRELSAQEREALARFWRLLLTWNARINLTGARTEGELVAEHLPDALAMERLVPAGSRVLDVGSGGGLPALPYAVLRPADPVVLVEPRAKRVALLRTAARELGLNRVEVLPGRIEEVVPGAADVASSRATFGPAEWLERALALAPRALVFATRAADVEAGSVWRLEGELAYLSGKQPRWTGLFVRA